MIQQRPAETVHATISTIVGAVVMILAGAGVDVDPKIVGGAIILLGYVPALVTWYVSHRRA